MYVTIYTSGSGGGASSSGGAGAIQFSDGAGGFSSAATLLAGTTYISIGTNPAQAGDIRLSSSGAIKFRTVSNAADVNGMSVASNVMTIGDAGAVNSMVITTASAGISVRPGSATTATSATFSGSANTALGIGSGTPSYGGGVGVVQIVNAGTVPSTNASSGGILYADTGALKWRGSSGTVTTIAPA